MPKLTAEQVAHFNDSKQGTLIGVLVLFLVLSNIAVIIRIVAELRLVKKLFLDDYAIVFAVLCSDAVIALYLVAIDHGLGLHFYRVIAQDPNLPSNVAVMFRALYFNAVLTGPTVVGVKLSLLWFYKRMFLVNQKWLMVLWWINLIFVILWGIATTIYYILQCSPPDFYWQRLYVELEIPHDPPITGSCSHSTATNIGTPLLLGVISDFVIWSLPIISLTKLQIPMKRKIGLVLIFSIGFLACACAAARTALEFDTGLGDPTYTTVPFVILNTAESILAIIAACAPLIASQWRWTIKTVRERSVASSQDSKVALHTHTPKKLYPSLPEQSYQMESISGSGNIPSAPPSERQDSLRNVQIQGTNKIYVGWTKGNNPV